MTARIEIDAVAEVVGSTYPPPFDEACRQRVRRRLGDVAGLTQFGVNLMQLPPGCWSSQRHWHTAEDEFVFVLEGEVVLVTDAGEETLRAGDCAGFAAGRRDGHHLQNRSPVDALVLEVGTRRPADDETIYPDIDLWARQGDAGFAHRDGKPYPDTPRPRGAST
jgi:uncharacterized cupin superfamily protein